MATLVHFHGTKSKAQDIVFASLPWALPVALTVDELLVGPAIDNIFLTRKYAGAIVIIHAIRTDRGTDVALGDDERWRALWVPSVIAQLAVMAFGVLSVATPERKRLFTSNFSFLKELRTSPFTFELGVGNTFSRLLHNFFSIALHLFTLLLSSALLTLTATSLLLLSRLLNLALSLLTFPGCSPSLRLLSSLTLLLTFQGATTTLLLFTMTTSARRRGMPIMRTYRSREWILTD